MVPQPCCLVMTLSEDTEEEWVSMSILESYE